MKKVIINGHIVIVPDNTIECLVCGGYFPITSFCNAGEKVQTRTNCTSCTKMDWDEMQALKAKTHKSHYSREYVALRRLINDEVKYNSFLTREELITEILGYPEDARFESLEDYLEIETKRDGIDFYRIDVDV